MDQPQKVFFLLPNYNKIDDKDENGKIKTEDNEERKQECPDPK